MSNKTRVKIRQLVKMFLQNWPSRVLVPLLATLGVLPVSNPGRNLPNLTFRWCSIPVLLSIMQLIAPFVIYFDLTYNNSAEFIAESTAASKKILGYTLVTASGLVSGLVRLPSLCYCEETIFLLRGAIKVKNELRRAGICREKFNRTQRALLLFCGICIASFVCRYLFITIKSIYANEKILHVFTTIPDSQIIRQCVLHLTNLIVFTAPAYALSFVILVGIHLLKLNEDFLHLLSLYMEGAAENKEPKVTEEFRRMATTEASSINAASHTLFRRPPYGQKLKNVQEIFKGMKELFEMYQRLAGWYVLALVFLACAQLVHKLGRMVIIGNVESTVTVTNVGGSAEAALIVCLVASFGEYYEDSIRTSQNQVMQDGAMNVDSYELDAMVQWYTKWRVRLTARNFFSIDHSMILKVMATVVTYSIFLFQLSLSEGSQKSCNSTMSCQNCV